MKSFVYCILLSGLGLFACRKAVEGCTEPRAQNFNPEADENCCCSFFQLRGRLNHSVDELGQESFGLGGTYLNNLGEALILNQAQMLISRARLVDAEGREWALQDSSDYVLSNGSKLRLANDWAELNPNVQTLVLGRMDRAGDYLALRFEVGSLNAENWGLVQRELLQNNHPLRSSNLLLNNRLLSYNFSLILPNSQDSFQLQSQALIPVELAFNLRVEEGRDTDINLLVNYLALFQNLDLSQTNAALINRHLLGQIPNMFKIL